MYEAGPLTPHSHPPIQPQPNDLRRAPRRAHMADWWPNQQPPNRQNQPPNLPQSSKLDYVVQPERDMSLAAQAAAPVSKKDEGKLAKKMREVVRRQKGSTARAAVPSVEGRNIVL